MCVGFLKGKNENCVRKNITDILQMSLKCNINNVEIGWKMMYN